jgi:hypothetical protein
MVVAFEIKGSRLIIFLNTLQTRFIGRIETARFFWVVFLFVSCDEQYNDFLTITARMGSKQLELTNKVKTLQS